VQGICYANEKLGMPGVLHVSDRSTLGVCSFLTGPHHNVFWKIKLHTSIKNLKLKCCGYCLPRDQEGKKLKEIEVDVNAYVQLFIGRNQVVGQV
jgi:hypothetical protein